MEMIHLSPSDRCDYNVVAVTFNPAKDGNSASITLALENANDPWGKGVRHTVFENEYPRVVKSIVDVMKAKGKTEFDEADCAELPAKFQKIPNAGELTLTLDKPMCRVWGSDTKGVTVAPGVKKDVKKGDIVLDGRTGLPKVYTMFTVFLAYISHDGNMTSSLTDYNNEVTRALRQFRPLVTETAPATADTGNTNPPAGNDNPPAGNTDPFAGM